MLSNTPVRNVGCLILGADGPIHAIGVLAWTTTIDPGLGHRYSTCGRYEGRGVMRNGAFDALKLQL
jgi:hypothetical protein